MIVQLDDLYICDRPAVPETNKAFWEEHNQWMVDNNIRPLIVAPLDIFFMDAGVALLYELRWNGH